MTPSFVWNMFVVILHLNWFACTTSMYYIIQTVARNHRGFCFFLFVANVFQCHSLMHENKV